MENNNDLCLYGNSKRRKIGNNKELESVANKSDESTCVKVKKVIENDGDAEEFDSDVVIIDIENDNKGIYVEVKDEKSIGDSASNHASMIPITGLQEKNTRHRNNDDQIKPLLDGSIECNCLSEKFGELEEEIIKRVRSEISVMRKKWEKSSCKCKYEMINEFGKFMLEIKKLDKENAQFKADKELLMKEKDQLEEKLQKEQEFRFQLSGMLKQDAWDQNKTNAGSVTESFKTNEKQPVTMSNTSQSSHSNEKNKAETSTSTKHTIHGYHIKNFTESKNYNKSSKLSFKEKMPDKIPTENLVYDEIIERKKRKCNIIVKGMKQRKGNFLLKDVKKLIWLRTGIWPLINNLRIIETGFLLEMKSLVNKLDIMKRKNMFRSLNIILEDDLTSREHQVQDWLTEVAREDAKLGKQTIVGYLKIKQDGVWKVWDEHLGNLVVDKTRSETQ